MRQKTWIPYFSCDAYEEYTLNRGKQTSGKLNKFSGNHCGNLNTDFEITERIFPHLI
jgi:hypothetical protein